MSVPRNYSDWINCFDILKAGTNDKETITLMQQGSIEWSRGVAERITQRLYDVINHRLKKISDKLNNDLDRCKGEETAIVKALVSARNRLFFIKQIIDLQAFPESVRVGMNEMIEDYAKNTQESLEKSALSDRTGRLRMMIKNNAISNFEYIEKDYSEPVSSESINNAASSDPILPRSTRRRVILP